MSKGRVYRSCREGALQLHHPFLCCDQPDILAFINISPASQCMNDAIILLLQPVCTRVTECLGPVSHLQTCSARFPDDYLCSAPRPNTKWQLLRYNDACRRRNVSTLRYSAAFFVGQLILHSRQWSVPVCALHPSFSLSGAFSAAAVWGGQRGGQICIWGRARIPDDIIHDWVNGVIWHQLCDATL